MIEQIITYSALYISLFFSVVVLFTLLSNRGTLHSYPTAKSLPFVSIIVPAWNEERYIAATVRSLLGLDYPRDKLEILVVNDGSTDRTSEIARTLGRRHKNLRVIDKPNGGKASALNMGVSRARGAIVACMDADSEVHRSALRMMVGHMDNPRVAAVTSSMKIKNKNASLMTKMQHTEYLFHMLLRKALCCLDCLTVAPGPFSLYRKSVVRSVGGFDDCNRVEDMDMTFRIHRAGYSVENVLDAHVWTNGPTTFTGLFNQRMRWFRGLIGTTLKYRDMVFSRNFGNFGMFLLPASSAFAVFTSLLFMVIVLKMSYSIAASLWSMHLIGFDLAYVTAGLRMPELSVLLVDFRTAIYVGVSMLGVLMLLLSYSKARERVRDGAAGVLGFLLLMPLLLSFFWTLAMFYELTGKRKMWLHKGEAK
ncbi:MAG: glycosyltransferase family 2 protein [Candidatus Aenigmatarchaeota archaeon]|nr:MAG: glycosyltransferase family 2 protein [Candidatus Aenigmarchaeota archaeon]